MANLVCGSRCEQSWPLGTAGECDETTLECVCPPGFDGVDDWFKYNDCHVNIGFRQAMRTFAFVVNVIQFLFASYGLLQLWWHAGKGSAPRGSEYRSQLISKFRSFNPISLPPRGEVTGTATSMRNPIYGVPQEEPLSRRQRAKRDRKEEARNERLDRQESARNVKVINLTLRKATYLLRFFAVFGLSGAIYQVFFVLPVPITRGERNAVQNFCVAVASASISCGLWILAYLWYTSLPSIQVYGKLFGLNNFLVRFPNSFRIVSFAHMGLALTSLMAFLFLLPLVAPEKSTEWDRAATLCMFVLVVNWTLMMTYVCWLLRQVYFKSLNSLQEQTHRLRQRNNKRKGKNDDDESVSTASSAKSNDSVMSAVKRGVLKLTGKSAPPRTRDRNQSEQFTVFQEAENLVRQTTIVVVVTGSSASAVLLGLSVSPWMRSSMYLFFNLLAIIASFAALCIAYFVVFRAFRDI